jgi:hypothetical protein
MLSYLYKKYLDWSDYYRNREPNQYGTTLYPRTLDPLSTYPAVVAVAAEPQCENTIDLRRKTFEELTKAKRTYKEALVNNLKKI